MTMIGKVNYAILPYIFSIIGKVGNYLSNTYHIYFIIATIVIVLLCKNTNERLENFKPNLIAAVLCSILLFLSIISFAGISTFIYFNF